MSTTTEDVIKSAASVARDVAEGRLASAALDQAAADECRALFGTVAGPDDPLWALHVDVTRQVLAWGGVGADELGEWAAVMRRRTQEAVRAVEPSEPSQGPDVTPGAVTSLSAAHSPENPHPVAESDAEAEADPVVVALHGDPETGADR